MSEKSQGVLLGEAAEVMEVARLAMEQVLGDDVDPGDYERFCEWVLPGIHDALLTCGKKIVEELFPGTEYP